MYCYVWLCYALRGRGEASLSARCWVRLCGPPPAGRAAATGGAGSRPQPGAAVILDLGLATRAAAAAAVVIPDLIHHKWRRCLST